MYNAVVFHVVGDFIVDTNLDLTGVNIKVSPGAKILVESSNYNQTSLSLNFTFIFACSGLWKGIEMSAFTSITTTNGTIIEDAENAIKALNTGAVSLNINNTTFNRNVVGINLEASNYTYFPPMLNYFVNNSFTCTSPLNGTTNGKTNIGLRMVNINYPLAFNYGNYNNTFKGIRNGIYVDAAYGVMGFSNYYFQAIEGNSIEFKNGNQLNVKNCDFSNIGVQGISTTSAGTLIVEDSKFSVTTQVGSSYSREVISVSQPKEGNSCTIQRNEFTTSGYLNSPNSSSYNTTSLIKFISGGSNTVNAQIITNKFNQLDESQLHPNQQSASFSVGVWIGGAISTSSSIQVEDNDFNMDIPNTDEQRNEAIRLTGGNQNNIKIVGNRFVSGPAYYFCSVGGVLGIGNEFSNNIFNLGQNGLKTVGGLLLKNTENFKICSNTDNLACFPSYGFVGNCFNTNFIRNTTYGKSNAIIGGASVIISGIIGEQIHKGNLWYPSPCSPPFNNITCHPLIIHNNLNTAFLSKFTVHTPQSDLHIPSNTYTYLSPYFPHYIVPDAIGNGFWATDLNGTPAVDCTVPGPNPGGTSENLIALNGLSDYLRSPVQQYDAEMYLYRSIKANPAAFNGNRAYNSFLQRNNGKNKDKFTDLEKAIDESDKIKEATNIKVGDLRNQIKRLDAEAKRYSKTNPASVDIIKAWYKQRLDLDDNINTLYKEHKSEKKIKHQNTKRTVDAVVATALNERLIKDVYSIYLDAQINNEGKFSTEQIKRLKEIAQTCFTEGGMIVYVARSFLSQNDLRDIQGIIDICEPLVLPEVTTESIATPINTAQQKQSTGTTVYPNPAGESFTINVATNLKATAQITDITGKIVKTYDLQEGTNTLQHGLSKGLYILNIRISDGKIVTEKLAINY